MNDPFPYKNFGSDTLSEEQRAQVIDACSQMAAFLNEPEDIPEHFADKMQAKEDLPILCTALRHIDRLEAEIGRLKAENAKLCADVTI